MKSALVMVGAALVFGSFAADVTFPNADGSGDLASPAAWGDVQHTSSDRLVLPDVSATYTASADIAFAGIAFPYGNGGKRSLMDLSNQSGRTVTLSGSVSAAGSQSTNEFCGGKYVFTAGEIAQPANNIHDHGWVFSGGCVATNIAQYLMGNGGGNNSLTVKDAAKVWFAKTIRGDSYYRSAGHRLSVLSGGELHLLATAGDGKGAFMSDNPDNQYGEKVVDNRVLVDGEGSLFRVLKGTAVNSYVGYRMQGNQFVVSNGGCAVFESGTTLRIGNADISSDNLLRIESGATLSADTVAIGYAGGPFNRFEVLSCATATCGVVQFAGNTATHDNTILVSNATLNCTQVKVASTGASANTVRVTGPDGRLEATVSNYDYFYRGTGNEIEVSDGATLLTLGDSSLCSNDGTATHSNRISAVSGGTISCTGTFWLGCRHNAARPIGNTLNLAGGTLTAAKFNVNGIANVVVVSNGTLSTTNGGVAFAKKESWTGETSNLVVRIQGDHPSITTQSGGVEVLRDTQVVFDLPVNGYLDGLAPIRPSGQVDFSSDSTIVLEGLEACCEQLEGRTLLMSLVQAGPNRNLNVPDAVVEKANADLIARGLAKCRLYKDGNALVLKAKNESGLILVFR